MLHCRDRGTLLTFRKRASTTLAEQNPMVPLTFEPSCLCMRIFHMSHTCKLNSLQLGRNHFRISRYKPLHGGPLVTGTGLHADVPTFPRSAHKTAAPCGHWPNPPPPSPTIRGKETTKNLCEDLKKVKPQIWHPTAPHLPLSTLYEPLRGIYFQDPPGGLGTSELMAIPSSYCAVLKWTLHRKPLNPKHENRTSRGARITHPAVAFSLHLTHSCPPVFRVWDLGPCHTPCKTAAFPGEEQA